MNYNRKNFIRIAAAGIAITAISGELIGCSSGAKNSSTANATGNLGQFGLQLYTLRDIIGNDPKGILKQVADMGYKQIEGYEDGKMGIYWGMSNTEFKSYLDQLGMQMISTHCNINKDFEKKADEAAAIGMKYLICPGLGDEAAMDASAWKKAADLFNEKGAICKKAGMGFAYHNHDGSFTQLDSGTTGQKILMDNTDPSLVDYEMDIYWVVTGGQDPITWFQKYPGRFKLCHIKDREKGAPLSDREASVDVGTGGIDFAKVLAIGKDKGLEYYIVEQEKYVNTTPLQAAKTDADYLKKLRI
ncbi:MAG: sugar phosphate isomerase/epimerase [Ginsengibacter sp.]